MTQSTTPSSVFDPFDGLTLAEILDKPSLKVKRLIASLESSIHDPILMRLALTKKAELATVCDDSVAMSNYVYNEIETWLMAEPRRDDETVLECLVRLCDQQSPTLVLLSAINLDTPLDVPTKEMFYAEFNFVVEHLTGFFEDKQLTLADVATLTQQQLITLVAEHLESQGKEYDEIAFHSANQGTNRLLELAGAFDSVKREQQAALAVAVG